MAWKEELTRNWHIMFYPVCQVFFVVYLSLCHHTGDIFCGLGKKKTTKNVPRKTQREAKKLVKAVFQRSIDENSHRRTEICKATNLQKPLIVELMKLVTNVEVARLQDGKLEIYVPFLFMFLTLYVLRPIRLQHLNRSI